MNAHFSLNPKRTVTMDIETVSLDPADPKGALEAMTGRIVCIGMLFDDGTRLNPVVICDADERKILERFWASITDTDQLVGHNILAFDLMFIRQRSWILRVKPPVVLNLRKYYTEQVVDLMEMWTNWSTRFKGASLDNIATVLGVGEKTGHGSEVAALWAAGDTAALMKYCMSDVWLSYQVYCKMTYREPLGVPLPAELQRAPYEQMLQAAAAPAPEPAREMVYAQKSAVPAANGNGANQRIPSQPAITVAQPTSQSRRTSSRSSANRSKGRRVKQISYCEWGGALILEGDTYVVSQAKEALGARGEKKDEKWVWQVPAGRMGELANLCAQNAIQLVAAGDGTLHLPRA